MSGGLGRKVKVGDRVPSNMVQTKQRCVPKYQSSAYDMSWASNGMVVFVLNEDDIPVLQRRIFYAGFDKLDLIPLGANKVFLRTLEVVCGLGCWLCGMVWREGDLRREVVRHQLGGVTCLLCVGRAGLTIMLSALLAMGNTRFFGRMCGLGGCRLVSGLVVYMTCRSLRSQQCLR